MQVDKQDLYIKAGAPLFFGIHGLAGRPREFSYLAKQLGKAGISTYAPILPGHGAPLDVFRKVTRKDWLDALQGHLQQVSQEHSPIFVGGLCWGALLALALALREPQMIRGLILYAPNYFYDGWNLPKPRALTMAMAFYTPLRWFFMFATDRPPYGIKDPRLRAYIAALYRRGDQKRIFEQLGHPRIPATTFYQMHRLRAFIRRHLQEIHTPALFLHSREDDFTSPRSSEFLCGHLGSEDKRLILLDDCYHLITVDQKKDEVFTHTLSFIQQHMHAADHALATPGVKEEEEEEAP